MLSPVVSQASPSAAVRPGHPGHPAPPPSYGAQVRALMQHMTLKQKVGQLFVIEVAGRDAYTVSDTAMATNQTLYGVDTPAEAIAKYLPGGVIYYTTRNNDDNIGSPAQVASLRRMGASFTPLSTVTGLNWLSTKSTRFFSARRRIRWWRLDWKGCSQSITETQTMSRPSSWGMGSLLRGNGRARACGSPW